MPAPCCSSRSSPWSSSRSSSWSSSRSSSRSVLPVRLAFLFTCALALFAPPSDAFRALGIFPFNGHSHNIFFKALMEALAERGHQVTVLSPFPLKTPKANYTDVDLSSLLPPLTNGLKFENMVGRAKSIFGTIDNINHVAGNDLCRLVFGSQQFKDIISGRHGHFDVVLTEIFGSDCWAVVPYVFKVPLVSLTSAPDMQWIHDRMGSIDNPSYITSPYVTFVGKMNFWQRVTNVYLWFMSKLLHKIHMEDGSDPVVREFFGEDVPPISELIRNTSLVLVNRHISIHAARPVNPNVVNVGGLHVRANRIPEDLDADLRGWMDGAEHGVVFFSLGSLVPSSSLPESVQRQLLAAFASLPQRVLWKFETSIHDLPPNVRVSKWMPQLAILTHPKTILFITHGGLMGTTEAIIAGVPMLGIPLFADQLLNVELYKSLGIAGRLDNGNLTTEAMREAVISMTATDKYLRRAREVSALYKDRPMSAEDEAVWWVEFVVRHRGAPHLRPLGADLPLYEYLLLDVAAAAVALLVAVGALLWCLIVGTTKKSQKLKTH